MGNVDNFINNQTQASQTIKDGIKAFINRHKEYYQTK